jgi:hypothetical protein
LIDDFYKSSQWKAPYTQSVLCSDHKLLEISTFLVGCFSPGFVEVLVEPTRIDELKNSLDISANMDIGLDLDEDAQPTGSLSCHLSSLAVKILLHICRTQEYGTSENPCF